MLEAMGRLRENGFERVELDMDSLNSKAAAAVRGSWGSVSGRRSQFIGDRFPCNVRQAVRGACLLSQSVAAKPSPVCAHSNQKRQRLVTAGWAQTLLARNVAGEEYTWWLGQWGALAGGVPRTGRAEGPTVETAVVSGQ